MSFIVGSVNNIAHLETLFLQLSPSLQTLVKKPSKILERREYPSKPAPKFSLKKFHTPKPFSPKFFAEKIPQTFKRKKSLESLGQ